MSQRSLPPFLSSWKSVVGVFLVVLALILFLLGRFDVFQALVIGAIGVILI